MIINTTNLDIIESFESSFQDKKIIPFDLEMMWLKKANAEFKTEIHDLEYDEELGEYSKSLDQYIVDTLAKMIKVYYLERELSRVNKIASIVGKDLSVNGTNGLQKYTKEEYITVKAELEKRLYNLKPTAYNQEVLF